MRSRHPLSVQVTVAGAEQQSAAVLPTSANDYPTKEASPNAFSPEANDSP
jgi:hypothetical protein